MQKSKFTESQIMATIKKQKSGVPVKEISRGLVFNHATFIIGKPNLVAWRSAMSRKRKKAETTKVYQRTGLQKKSL